LREFFDSSVLIAAFWGGHANHGASIQCLSGADKKHSSCGIHSLGEVYAVMSSLPVAPGIPAEQVMLFVEEVRSRLILVSLDEKEYLQTIQKCADRGFTSGRIYDALLLSCAAKSGAQTIFTWDLKHFQSTAPELADRIRTP
jgi:predicted nucleic acid-binding protein